MPHEGEATTLTGSTVICWKGLRFTVWPNAGFAGTGASLHPCR